MQINDDTSRALETIRAYQKDIADFDANIKTQSEMVNEMVEAAPESARIAELETELAEQRAQLKSRLMGNGAYNDAKQNLADERDARKSAQKHLSDALVVWYTITGASQIELTDETAREVIVSAKLGKEQLYQTTIFEKEQK